MYMVFKNSTDKYHFSYLGYLDLSLVFRVSKKFKEESLQIHLKYNLSNIPNRRDSVSLGYPDTNNRVENMTHSRVFSTKF